MKKVFPLLVILAFIPFISCDSDDDSENKTVPADALQSMSDTMDAIDAITKELGILDSSAKISSKVISKPKETVTNDYYTVSWSYNDTTKTLSYTVTIIADYTVTTEDEKSLTLKAGGTDTCTIIENNSSYAIADAGNFPYVFNDKSHTIGWNFDMTETDTSLTISGTVTFDGTEYSYSGKE